MHPVLFKLGPIPVYAYGTMLALAFLIGIRVAQGRGRRMGVDPQLILDLSLSILIGAILGSRLLHVILNWKLFQGEPLSAFKIWQGGLDFHGGLIGATLATLWYLRKKKVSPWKVGDVIIPSVPLGHALGRIGCFLNGCCYGKPATLPWGVTFPPGSFAAAHFGASHHIHPVQLYEAAVDLLIFLILWARTPRIRFNGQLFCLYLLIYAVARFFLEYFRADNPPVVLSLSFYQLLSVALFLLGMVLLRFLRGKN